MKNELKIEMNYIRSCHFKVNGVMYSYHFKDGKGNFRVNWKEATFSITKGVNLELENKFDEDEVNPILSYDELKIIFQNYISKYKETINESVLY